MSAAKKKPPPAPAAEKPKTKNARKKLDEKPKPVAVPSKHQLKKKAKEAKKVSLKEKMIHF